MSPRRSKLLRVGYEKRRKRLLSKREHPPYRCLNGDRSRPTSLPVIQRPLLAMPPRKLATHSCHTHPSEVGAHRSGPHPPEWRGRSADIKGSQRFQ